MRTPSSSTGPRQALTRCLAAAVLLGAGLALAPAWGHGKGGGGGGGGGGGDSGRRGGDNERARGGGDHERARNALQSGAVLPLATLLEQLRRSHPGQVLEVEFDREDGRLVYEVKLLHTNGQLLKLQVDAATGQVLNVRQKDK